MSGEYRRAPLIRRDDGSFSRDGPSEAVSVAVGQPALPGKSALDISHHQRLCQGKALNWDFHGLPRRTPDTPKWGLINSWHKKRKEKKENWESHTVFFSLSPGLILIRLTMIKAQPASSLPLPLSLAPSLASPSLSSLLPLPLAPVASLVVDACSHTHHT